MRRSIIVVAVLAAAITIWVWARHGGTETAAYRFVTVEQGTVESVVSATGTLRATSTVQVGTQVSGRIEAIYVDFNDEVKQGQLIARIDPMLLQQEVRSAKASVERSRAELQQATREMERAERLYTGKVLTESEYTTAQYQLSLAQTSFESAQIGLDKAQRNLTYTDILAPVDGTVLERNVDVGQTVAASLQAPQLFLIAGNLSQMEILALVDESDIGKIAPNQVVRFTVQAFPERHFDGKVRQVRLQSTMQENVVSYMVAVDVENADGKLLPGMTATVEFIVEKADNVLKVAATALRFQPTETMVADMRAQRTRETSRAAVADTSAQTGRRGESRTGDRADRPATERRGRSRRSDRGVLWTVDQDGKLAVIRVKVGISDGQFSVVESPDLAPGMDVIAAVTTTAASSPTNPFDNRSNQDNRRRPRTGF